MTAARWRASIAVVVTVVALGGCGAPAREPRFNASPSASIWRARCGACHAPVQPGTREEGALRAAAQRHERRVHLTPAEWDALVLWLVD